MRLTSLLRYATECIRNRPPPRPLPVIKSPPNAKVAVFGSSNLTDAILLDLQMSSLLEEIRVFDVKAKAVRLSEDLNQIASTSVIRPYYGTYQIGCAVHGVDVIVLAGGHYGTPGEPMQEIFKKNLPSLLDMAYECAHHNPKAHVIVLTPPGTRNVPLISELYEKVGQKDDCQIMAPMYQHEMLVSKLVAENLRLAPNCVSMPVVGGCCVETVIPVFSCAAPQNEFSKGVIEDILYTMRHSNESVAVLQRGQPPAFAPAMAASRLVLDIVRGSFGIEQPPHSVFMRSHVLMNVKYLGTPVSFGPGGVKKTNFMPQLSESEMKMLAKAVVQLQEDARIAEAAASAKWNELD